MKGWKRHLLSWLGLIEGAVPIHYTHTYLLFRKLEYFETPVHKLVKHITFIMRCESRDIIRKGLCVILSEILVGPQELFSMPRGQTLGAYVQFFRY